MGMDATTGAAVSGLDAVRQSVHDIVTTPPGTRLMRRDYGCGVWDYVDGPITQPTRVAMIAAVASALRTFEPRVSVTSVTVEATEPTEGRLAITINALYLNQPFVESITL